MTQLSGGEIIYRINSQLAVMHLQGGAAFWYDSADRKISYIEIWKDHVTEENEYGGRSVLVQIRMKKVFAEDTFKNTVKRYLGGLEVN